MYLKTLRGSSVCSVAVEGNNLGRKATNCLLGDVLGGLPVLSINTSRQQGQLKVLQKFSEDDISATVMIKYEGRNLEFSPEGRW